MPTLSQNGMTTIPENIRLYLGVDAGDRLEFIIDSDGRVILIPLTEKVTLLKGMLAKPKMKQSTKQMNKAISKR